jgi:hypothetical protein
MRTRIPSDYLLGKTQARQAEVKRLWKLENQLMEELKQVINRLLEDADKTSESDYDKLGWPYWRADRDGYKRALERVRLLLP